MLTVPAPIKALYKQDGVKKYVRVIFPNGELTTLTNTNIVAESLVYTESLCSQDVFRFGLAEASRIEFETVGVANMFGMQIRVELGIATASLSAADRTAVINSPGSGSYADGVYWLKLGTFRVTSCPRDKRAMTHRKVTAYTAWPDALSRMSVYERFKQEAQYQAHSSSPKLQLNLTNFVFAATGIGKGGASPAWTSSQYVSTDNDTPDETVTETYYFQAIKRSDPSQTATWPITVSRSVYLLQQDAVYNTNNIGNTVAAPLAAQIESVLPAATWQLVPMPITGGPSFTTMEPFLNWIAAHRLCYSYETHGTATELPMQLLPNDDGLFYPNGLARTPAFLYAGAATFSGTTVQPGGVVGGQVRIWAKSSSDTIDSVSVAFDPTLKAKVSGKNVVSYLDTVDALALIRGYYELQARFLRPQARDSYGNAQQVVQLSTASPEEVGPAQIDELWWDEYSVEPIGTVLYSYPGADGAENKTAYAFGDGGSVYDMRDNAVLKALANASESAVNALLDAIFIPNAQAAAFSPVELDMVALPWLESGDALQLTTEDESQIDTFALVQTMSGVQLLMDSITAAGGEIIEEAST